MISTLLLVFPTLLFLLYPEDLEEDIVGDGEVAMF